MKIDTKYFMADMQYKQMIQKSVCTVPGFQVLFAKRGIICYRPKSFFEFIMRKSVSNLPDEGVMLVVSIYYNCIQVVSLTNYQLSY